MLQRLTLVAFAAACACVCADESPVQKAADQLANLTAEYETASEAWSRRFDPAEDDIDWLARYRDWPAFAYAPRFLEISEAGGKDVAAFRALRRILEFASSVSTTDQELLPVYERSLELLLRDHRDHEELRDVCRTVSGHMSASTERFLRTLSRRGQLTRNPR